MGGTQFGNCHRSLRAHDDSVMQVKFLPGTHYIVTAGRDKEVKLWDCDTFELITALKGHATEILAMGLSQDASFIVTAGGDKQIRFWNRSNEQLFLSEERAKELEDKFEQEVEREDLPGVNGAPIVDLRPSRRTVESIRSTEHLMEVLDEATAADKEADSLPVGSRHPCVRVVAYLNTLTANNVYEVLLALPFAQALRLLGFVCRFFEAIVSLPSQNGNQGSAGSLALTASGTLETPCQVALIAAYVHHHELAASPGARALLMKLRGHMRKLLQAEKDQIGLSIAGFSHLHRVLKRNSGALSAPVAPAAPAAPAAKGGEKRKRK